MSNKQFREWGSEELSGWLQDNGVPGSVCDIFEDELVDGATFLELTEVDVKSIIKPLGHVKRVLRLIKSKANSEEVTDSPATLSLMSDGDLPVTSPTLPSPPASLSTRSCDYDGSVDSSVKSVSPKFRDGVPLEYSLPKAFSSAVMGALNEKHMEPKVRSAFVRELVVHMTSFGMRPPRNFCSLVARRIITKYPFLRDAIGNGYASWEKRLIDRVYNVCKVEKRKRVEEEGASVPKKLKIIDRYPPLSMSEILDEDTNCRNKAALDLELAKQKPNKPKLLELMELTFAYRREFVLHEAESVTEILQKYPALSRPDVIVQEMELILKCGKNTLLSEFQKKWQTKWVPAILELSETFSKKSAQALTEPPNYGLEADHLCQIRAVWCLAAIFSNVSKKDKEKHPEYYWIEDYDMAEDPELSAQEEPIRCSPRIARFQSMHTRADYYVFIEQKVFVKVESFTLALFIWFCAHYIFNLEYHKFYQNGAMFIQEFIFDLPECDSRKKKASYLTAVTELHRLAQK